MNKQVRALILGVAVIALLFAAILGYFHLFKSSYVKSESSTHYVFLRNRNWFDTGIYFNKKVCLGTVNLRDQNFPHQPFQVQLEMQGVRSRVDEPPFMSNQQFGDCFTNPKPDGEPIKIHLRISDKATSDYAIIGIGSIE